MCDVGSAVCSADLLGFSRRYGRLGGRAFAGRPDCRVPSLEDTAACLLDLGLTPNVEIKPTPGLAAKTAEVALTRLLALWPRDRLPPLVSSFERASLTAARRAATSEARRGGKEWVGTCRSRG